MRILVTGGAGYIGSITTRTLLDAGHDVAILDSLVRGHEAAVDPRARLVVGGVGDRAAVDDALDGRDAVLHCAGLIEVAESEHDPGAYWRANLTEPLVLLDAMRARGVDALVFSSTAAVYGEPESTPIREDARLAPINTYGATKLAFEHAIASQVRAYGLRAVRLRYFNVAGAWPDGSLGEAHQPETHIIPRILGALATGRDGFEVFGDDYPTPDGTCVRDYIHVCDLAQAHRLALERVGGFSSDAGSRGEASGGEASDSEDPAGQLASGAVYNLGSGRGFSNLEVVRACAEVVGRDVEVTIGPRRAGDPAVLLASSEAAGRELGWVPERGDLATMIADAWRWHESHPEGYRTA